jgi:hypothetical protein
MPAVSLAVQWLLAMVCNTPGSWTSFAPTASDVAMAINETGCDDTTPTILHHQAWQGPTQGLGSSIFQDANHLAAGQQKVPLLQQGGPVNRLCTQQQREIQLPLRVRLPGPKPCKP